MSGGVTILVRLRVIDVLTYNHQQVRCPEFTISDHVVLVDGSRVYGRHVTTLNNGEVDDDWIFECGVFAQNIAVYKKYIPPNYEFE